MRTAAQSAWPSRSCRMALLCLSLVFTCWTGRAGAQLGNDSYTGKPSLAHIEFLPTVLAAGRLDLPDKIDAKSLHPHLAGDLTELHADWRRGRERSRADAW